MPILPTADSFGVSTPTASTYAPVDPNPGVVGQAYTALGRGAQALGQGVRDAGKAYDSAVAANDQLEYAAANSAVVQERVRAEQEIPNDPKLDPTGWQKAFEDRLNPFVQVQAAKISDARYRKMFEIGAGQHVALGSVAITKMAEAKRADQGRAALDLTIRQNDEAMWAVPADETLRKPLMEASTAAIDAAVASGYVTADWAAARKRQIAVDYARNLVEAMPPAEAMKLLDPESPAKKTNTSIDFLSPEQRRALFYQKRQDAAAVGIDIERQQRLLEEQQKAASEAAKNQIIGAVFSGDPSVASSITAADVARNPTLTPSDKLQMIGVINREGKGEPPAEVSRATTTQLLAGIRRPEGDPTRVNDMGPIYDQFIAGKLSRTDFVFLRDELTQRAGSPDGERFSTRVGDFMKGMKPSIDKSNPLMGTADPLGARKFYEFEQYVSDRIAAYRKAGKDPNDLLNPASPDYLGSENVLSRFYTSMGQSISHLSSQLTETTQPPPSTGPEPFSIAPVVTPLPLPEVPDLGSGTPQEMRAKLMASPIYKDLPPGGHFTYKGRTYTKAGTP